jgi:type IV secretion system protein VirB9
MKKYLAIAFAVTATFLYSTSQAQTQQRTQQNWALKPVGLGTTVVANPKPLDERIVQFPFNQDGIFRVQTRVQNFTRLSLGKGEQVKGFYLSDTIQWEMHVAADKTNVFVKPINPDISTTGTLITNKRTYDLDFTETTRSSTGWHQRVTWSSPAEDTPKFFEEFNPNQAVEARPAAERVTLGPCDPSSTSKKAGFSISGDAGFKPTAVWSDGKFSCILLPEAVEEVPALFVLSAEGQPELSDYKLMSGMLVVPRSITHGALLKLGNQEVSISGQKAGVQ